MIGPVVAPFGTVAVSRELELTVNAAVIPLNATLVAPVNFFPFTVTDEPTDPEVGLNEVTEGASGDDGLGGGDPSPRLQLWPALMQSFTAAWSADWSHVFQKSAWRLRPCVVLKFASEDNR
jgi:hypothetical protein